VPNSSSQLQIRGMEQPGLESFGNDEDPRNPRQTRSRSIGTVPTQYDEGRHAGRPEKQTFTRRCSSASPKGRNHQRMLLQQQQQKQQQQTLTTLRPQERFKGDLTPPRIHRRRSSCKLAQS